MRTLRELFLVSRTGDPPFVDSKTPPCVHSKRTRVYRHHAYMFQHMCAWCRHTRGRFKCTHGNVIEPTHGFFHFYSACRNTHKHTRTRTHQTHHDHQTTPRPQRHTPHNTTHNITRRQKEKERETERQRKRDKTRQEKTVQDKKTREDERGETRQEDKRR